jgi:diphosphomevalonate decarboxylase
MADNLPLPVRVRVTASPSLALLKYWGKEKSGINIPATSSIAVTLSGLETVTEISTDFNQDGKSSAGDQIIINDEPVSDPKIELFLRYARDQYPLPSQLTIRSRNNFPTSAGLASSSSGFAALAAGLGAYIRPALSGIELSALARAGSGSACRAVFGGFTRWIRGSEYAVPVYDHTYWEDLRILLILVTRQPKSTGSRSAMNHCSQTSPVFSSWIRENHRHEEMMLAGLQNRDLEQLGAAMRQSYLFMFSTMFTADPPVIYWLPESMAVIRACEKLRRNGLNVWETMDAGPQVKLLCQESETGRIVEELEKEIGPFEYRLSRPGLPPAVETCFD